MASTIKLKNGSGAPLASDLVQGEPALDLTNKRLYTEDSGGDVIEVGTNPTELQVDNINIDGNAITSTDTDGNIAITPNGTGEVDISKVDIDSGTIDGVTIGGASAGAGTFTTITGSGDMAIDTDTLFVDVSENRVGIGTSSPTKLLHLSDASSTPLLIERTNSNANTSIEYKNTGGSLFSGIGGTQEFAIGKDPDLATLTNTFVQFKETELRFRTQGTERMRIDSSGNVGIGTSSPSFPLDIVSNSSSNALQLRGRSLDNTSRFELRSNDAATHYGTIFAYNNALGIDAPQASGKILFNTNGSEAMRIDSSGNLLVGGTSPDLVNSARAYFERNINSSSNSNTVTDQNSVVNIDGNIGQTNTEAATSLLSLTGNSGFATTPGRLIKGYGGNGATTHCFEVQHDGDVLNTNNSYGSISDERAKQDIADASSSWDDIKNIKVRKYRLKSNVEEYANNPNLGDAPYHIGVISQEVETVSPGLISQDLLDDGTPDPDAMKHVKYSVLYMKAVKALQEAMDRVETLETTQADLLARIETLEGN